MCRSSYFCKQYYIFFGSLSPLYGGVHLPYFQSLRMLIIFGWLLNFNKDRIVRFMFDRKLFPFSSKSERWQLREKCPNTELFLVRNFPYSDSVSLRSQSECGEKRTRKNSVFGHFSSSGSSYVFVNLSYKDLSKRGCDKTLFSSFSKINS